MINKYFLAKMNIPAYLKKFLYNRYGAIEVEGIPPIIFKGNGKNLIDYRIDGASGGVGDRTKNLLKNTADSRTINGVTFTVNNDKSITCNGTASATIDYRLVALNSYSLPAGNYHLTGAPQTASYSSYYLRVWYNSSGSVTGINDFGRGANFTLTDTTTILCAIIIASQQVLNNVTFYPMIRLASIEDDTYEPYGYNVPVVVSGKNLFDGIYGANHFSKIEPDKTITISTKSTGESSITFVYKKSDGTRFGYTRLLNENETSGSVTVTTPSEAVGIGIYAATDYTSQTIAYDTLIEYGDIATTYEPYHEPTTTNIYINEPIEENESISLSDTNINIPTFKGTNVLTVDTTVQPTNVFIKVGGD